MTHPAYWINFMDKALLASSCGFEGCTLTQPLNLSRIQEIRGLPTFSRKGFTENLTDGLQGEKLVLGPIRFR